MMKKSNLVGKALMIYW